MSSTKSKSWVSISKGSHFSLANIPFGIITSPASPSEKHVAIAIGDHALDLAFLAQGSGFSSLPSTPSPIDHDLIWTQPTLNAFAALGQASHNVVREYIQSILASDTKYPGILRDNDNLRSKCLIPLSKVTMHLPMHIGDYTDFYAGRHHAYNVGCMFRGPANALQPNYTHLPVGYHGRASSVVVSGTPIKRPHGQILPAPPAAGSSSSSTTTTSKPKPIFAPTRKLDLELELGAFLCTSTPLGVPLVPASKARSAIFGYVLLNDWSARDVQAWEYVPLGPFNSKNFGSTISAWVVLASALEPFRARGLENETELLPYLVEEGEDGSSKGNMLDIKLEVDLKPSQPSTTNTKATKATTISRTSATNLLFSFPQMLAHHTSTGCPMAVGDLLGSGTISGPDEQQQQQQQQHNQEYLTTPISNKGSLLEMTENGKTSLRIRACGSASKEDIKETEDKGTEAIVERKFLEDGDTVVIRGWCGNGDDNGNDDDNNNNNDDDDDDDDDDEAGYNIVGFGECVGTIEPALELNL